MPKPENSSSLLLAAEQALDAWNLCATQIECVSISENIVFRVDTESSETYALRLHRPGYHNLAELNAEHQWTLALNRAGIRVPIPKMTRDGRGYVRVYMPMSNETRYAGIVEWFDGVTLDSIIDQSSDKWSIALYFEQLGRIAARIHNQAVNWQIPDGFRRHELDADGLMGTTPFWGPFWDLPELSNAERKLILNTRSSIHHVLSIYGKHQGTYSLIHADLNPRNVVLTNDQLCLIDFDDAGFGWHQYELAVALFSYQDTSYFSTARDALIAGYRSKRALDDMAVELLPMYLLIRALASLGWLQARPELKKGGRKQRLIELACAQADDFVSQQNYLT